MRRVLTFGLITFLGERYLFLTYRSGRNLHPPVVNSEPALRDSWCSYTCLLIYSIYLQLYFYLSAFDITYILIAMETIHKFTHHNSTLGNAQYMLYMIDPVFFLPCQEKEIKIKFGCHPRLISEENMIGYEFQWKFGYFSHLLVKHAPLR